MNALELADELSNYLPSCDAEKFANVIRQQQAEIEHLKELFGCDPAYFEPDKKAKTLTDGEIKQLADYYGICEVSVVVIEFARAILRKAQEK